MAVLGEAPVDPELLLLRQQAVAGDLADFQAVRHEELGAALDIGRPVAPEAPYQHVAELAVDDVLHPDPELVPERIHVLPEVVNDLRDRGGSPAAAQAELKGPRAQLQDVDDEDLPLQRPDLHQAKPAMQRQIQVLSSWPWRHEPFERSAPSQSTQSSFSLARLATARERAASVATSS
eukprot:CAMPEP_0168365964 /NCGR_PEP_ID=MMETSP0228-20121227/4985_1 /TAXON_ID=133427 /ORGANISM="Protoceratium reticulatum, Strain CCCM 535 (=CCMP 1889)" /LENGTH=177 /DNA_ID=CAMNT_0008378753 /DNA_START=431 /DNA_END=961 /DNA_ORIENTATION=+